MSTLTEPRRLAQLPGYDTSPDVYETPSSQLPGSDESAVTPSTSISQDDSSTSDDSDAGSTSSSQLGGVSRRRLYPSQARKHFSSTSVRTRNVDWSDRVDGRRQGYRVRPRTGQEDGEDESLEARIARLKREVEECRVEASRRKEGQATDTTEPDVDNDSITALGQALAGLDVVSAAPRPSEPRTIPPSTPLPPDSSSGPETTTPLPKLSSFDTRLAALEATLGLTSLDAPSTTGTHPPLLPTLSLLDTQFAALSSASSLANLETLSSRISSLRAEARALQQQQQFNLPSTPAPRGPASTSDANDDSDNDADSTADPSSNPENAIPPHLSPEDVSKMSDLFTLLPTLSSLAPTVPALLTRLRSLRALHSAAASAAADLAAVETRQAEVATGLKAWREGLERVEEAVAEANAGNGRNGRMVKGWVDDLEARVQKLK